MVLGWGKRIKGSWPPPAVCDIHNHTLLNTPKKITLHTIPTLQINNPPLYTTSKETNMSGYNNQNSNMVPGNAGYTNTAAPGSTTTATTSSTTMPTTMHGAGGGTNAGATTGRKLEGVMSGLHGAGGNPILLKISRSDSYLLILICRANSRPV